MKGNLYGELLQKGTLSYAGIPIYFFNPASQIRYRARRRYRRWKDPEGISAAYRRQNRRLCKLRHRAFGTCTFYISETHINTGFLKVLLQNAHFVRVFTLVFLPCRTLQNAHFMGNCAIASLSSADYAAGRKKGIRGSDALTYARHSRETCLLRSHFSPLRSEKPLLRRYAPCPHILLRRLFPVPFAPQNKIKRNTPSVIKTAGQKRTGKAEPFLFHITSLLIFIVCDAEKNMLYGMVPTAGFFMPMVHLSL